jgi:hypothetical protein
VLQHLSWTLSRAVHGFASHGSVVASSFLGHFFNATRPANLFPYSGDVSVRWPGSPSLLPASNLVADS